ncbi:MAG: PAS domain-containing protein, partial [Dehalococcoidales bacterium]|nr:PAS domain-containing protein [Dehalococcoidales bacterium]
MRYIDKSREQLINELLKMRQRLVKLEVADTERKRAEQKIQQQSEFLNSVLKSLTYPFYVIDANDYTIKMANPAAKLGKLSENSTCYALTHNRDKPCTGVEDICPLQEVKKTRKPVVVEHIHYDKDGNARNVEVHGYPIFDSEGNVIQMIECSFDITERKQMEEAIK